MRPDSLRKAGFLLFGLALLSLIALVCVTSPDTAEAASGPMGIAVLFFALGFAFGAVFTFSRDKE